MDEKKINFPIRFGIRYRAAFVLIFLLLPAVLLCVAFFAVAALIRDLDIFGLDAVPSLVIKIAGAVICISAAGAILYKTYLHGTFTGYYYAVNSRRFKNELHKALTAALGKFKSLSQGIYDETEQEILRNFQECFDKMHGFKRIRRSGIALIKMETVVLNGAAKLRDILNSEDYTGTDFLEAVKKTHFCIDELLAGTVARAYQGSEPFVFISYSHRNTKKVLEIIKKLQEAKIHIWFDEGITEGDDWMDHIARRIDECARFVMFQTPEYVKSVNCNAEIKCALKNGKTIVRIILEDSTLPEGLGMYLDAIQAIDCRDGIAAKMNRIIEVLTVDNGDDEDDGSGQAAE
jgi:hypothetical protein